MATSVPAPMAIPMSARVRAGASLIPSPTMATRPFSESLRMISSLPSGSTPATTSSTPASRPMASAVCRLSPVSMTTRMPISRSSCTAWALSSLMVSATAMIPRKAPSREKKSGVLPCEASSSAWRTASSGTVQPSEMKRKLPPRIFQPLTSAVRPLPGTAVNSRTWAFWIPRAAQQSVTAFARGCSLCCSRPPAR